MQVTERSATESDKHWLWTLYQDLLKPCIEAQWGWDEDYQKALFESDLPVQAFVIHSLQGADVAASLVKAESDHYYVKMLLVVSDCQRLGVGRYIIDKLKERAGQHHKAIRLSVIQTNDVTGFYEKLCFDRVGEHDGSIKYQFRPE